MSRAFLEHKGLAVELGRGVLSVHADNSSSPGNEQGLVHRYDIENVAPHIVDDGLTSFVVVTTIYKCRSCKGTGSIHRVTDRGTAWVEKCECRKFHKDVQTIEDAMPTAELPGSSDLPPAEYSEEERRLDEEHRMLEEDREADND